MPIVLSSEQKEALEKIIARFAPSDVLKIRYSGSGDSGSIEDFMVNDRYDPILADQASDLCCELLYQLHPGWEIDDGAGGEFVIEVGARTIINNHNSYYTESEYSESKGEF